jgi:tRNA G18 (ribose-2'-O)-methylase SpoU
MGPTAIDDLADPRLAIYRSLKATNETRRLDQFVVEGERLAERLSASRFPLVSVLVTDRHLPKLLARVPEDVPVYVVPHALIDSIVGFPFHRGVLACGQRRPWPPTQELVERAGPQLTLVISPKLSNPENLGALARITDVFGANAILAGPECPDPFSRRVLRVSMGSVLQVPVVIEQRLAEITARLARDSGVELWGAVAGPSAVPFDSLRRPARLALLLGEEHRGIEPEWLSLCAQKVTIPMRAGAGSLNVSVAAGILLHQFTRRRS